MASVPDTQLLVWGYICGGREKRHTPEMFERPREQADNKLSMAQVVMSMRLTPKHPQTQA